MVALADTTSLVPEISSERGITAAVSRGLVTTALIPWVEVAGVGGVLVVVEWIIALVILIL